MPDMSKLRHFNSLIIFAVVAVVAVVLITLHALDWPIFRSMFTSTPTIQGIVTNSWDSMDESQWALNHGISMTQLPVYRPHNMATILSMMDQSTSMMDQSTDNTVAR